MNTSKTSSRTVFILIGAGILVVLILFSCLRNNDSAAGPTNTPVPTKTSLPTNTPKPTNPPPTNTPVPTNTPAPTNPAVDTPNPIQNIIWQWTSLTNQTTNETISIPNPSDYTISFFPDGTLSGTADCNTFSGTYSQNNGLTIKIGSSTNVACGEGSMDQQYLNLLDSIVAGGPDGSRLALETAGGEQRMLFVNGGAIVKP